METITTQPEQPTRPKFLQVLCILTFIGAGLLLLFSAMDINKTFLKSEEEKTAIREQTVAGILQMNPDADEDLLLENLSEMEIYEQPLWIIGVICNLLSLGGALLMWQLKKTGFYLYTAGELGSYLLTVLFTGTEGLTVGIKAASVWGSLGETLAITSFVAAVIFDIAFIAMYAMNTKHMR